MKVIDSLDFPNIPSSYIAIGSFDGIHKGHQYLIEKMINEARAEKHKSVVVTYYPIPRYVIGNSKDNIILTTKEEKIKFISQFNPDYLIIIKFDKDIWHMKAYDFIRKILVEKLNVKKIFIGKNHHFGYNREGNPEFLKSYETSFSYEVETIAPLLCSNTGVVISSSIIRKEIKDGNFDKAVNFLNHPYIISGNVIRGSGIGKKLGFPTANLEIPKGKLIPKKGVYAATAEINSKFYKGIVSIGTAPTIKNEKKLNIELHIFDFNAIIYGYKIDLFLWQFIREEQFFKNKNELIEQIKNDIEKTKDMLKEVTNNGFVKRRQNETN